MLFYVRKSIILLVETKRKKTQRITRHPKALLISMQSEVNRFLGVFAFAAELVRRVQQGFCLV